MGRLRTTFTAAAVLLAAISGCTLHKQDAPSSFTGPSGLGTSIGVSVSPDVLTQDGASQSLVTVTARDASGQPIRNLTLRTEIGVNGVLADFGSLSARTLVTDANGRATTVFTAPPPPVGPAPTTDVEILVTPLGTDFGNATPRTATIRLVPSGVTVPPRGSVTPSFTVTPASPLDHEPALFDASASTSTTGTIVSWTWNFGDGDTASGQTVQHIFDSPGSFAVTLTVTDSIGASNFVTRSVAVGQGTQPSATFTVSPDNPVVAQQVNFNASQSRPAPGRTITSYDWDFGDGTPHASGAQVIHVFSAPGTFTVLLTVTDDAGRTGTSTRGVTVGSDLPQARIIVSPAAPVRGTLAIADGSTSTAATGRTITSYQWFFSDDGGRPTGATVSHTFNTAGAVVVTLTVTDSVGRTNTATTTVTVANPTVAGGRD